jgi:integrase
LHDFERLVIGAKDEDWRAYVLVLLSGEAGLRLGEMAALEYPDLNLSTGELMCVRRSVWKGQIDLPKGHRVRSVQLSDLLIAALREHRHLRGPRVLYDDHGAPLSEGVIQGFVKRAARRAGLVNNGPHMLRHTFCSHLAMAGVPAVVIQALAGHADLRTTQRYMHLTSAASDSAIRRLESVRTLAGRGNGRIRIGQVTAK